MDRKGRKSNQVIDCGNTKDGVQAARSLCRVGHENSLSRTLPQRKPNGLGSNGNSAPGNVSCAVVRSRAKSCVYPIRTTVIV